MKANLEKERSLSHARLRDVLAYEPSTGIFTWIKRTGPKSNPGATTGTKAVADGYCRVQLDGRLHLAHRLAWFHVHGVWPKCQIDHINGNRSDNRLINLRDVSVSANKQNMVKAPSNSASGILGVRFRKNRWNARIWDGRHRIDLGCFLNEKDATAAYLEAKKRLHPWSVVERIA